MGYYTLFEDEISIQPPLAWKEIKDSPFVCHSPRGYVDRDLKLRVVEEDVDSEDGTLMRKYADAVVPVATDSYKGYSTVEHLQELLNTHAKSHSFKGYISATGENSGDLWRLAVVDGKAVKIKPEIVWPEIP
jgi:hypothetical protein